MACGMRIRHEKGFSITGKPFSCWYDVPCDIRHVPIVGVLCLGSFSDYMDVYRYTHNNQN